MRGYDDARVRTLILYLTQEKQHDGTRMTTKLGSDSKVSIMPDWWYEAAGAHEPGRKRPSATHATAPLQRSTRNTAPRDARNTMERCVDRVSMLCNH